MIVMQDVSEVFNLAGLLVAAAFLLAGLAATAQAERVWKQAYGVEIVFPEQPDRNDRIAARRGVYEELKRRWKLAIAVEIAAIGLGGFLLVVSFLGPNLVFGLGGSLLFLFFAGFENLCSKNRLPDECPDPLQHAESRLESIVSRGSSADTVEDLKQDILALVKSKNLTDEQTGYLLTYFSRRTDTIGEIARNMIAQRQ